MTLRIYCPSCSNEIRSDSNICASCGATLDEAATRRLESAGTPRTSQSSPSYDSIDNARFVPGTILADRYRIVGLLGKGGMGEVYRADDLKLGQPVALKFLPERLLRDGASLARFHREVRVARQVSHKNVCRVYDIGETGGHHFLSMEYIKGEELSSLLRRIGRLPEDKAIQLARQICAGLAAAHESGVLHRDLKPSNVMIDGDGNARVLDFGLAGLAEEFRDEEISSGTPAYMAPEQLEGTAVTVRSDIYSLGLVLYELFTGKKAFEAASLNELIKLRRSDTTPTTPTEIVKDLDPVIERVIERCMDKNPAQRPSSALQVAAALPGGDPLAAALAAGETPSPEMIAAAPKKGTLRPAVALGLLASVLVLLAVTMLLTKRVAFHRLVALNKSPELLKEQASQTAKSFGYAAAPVDVAHGFQIDHDYYAYLEKHYTSLNPWELLKHSQPSMLRFWYRQSPRLLAPYNAQNVSAKDPPNEIPGMVLMSIDTEGKLFYFEAVPEQVQSPKSNVQSQDEAVSSSAFRVSSQNSSPDEAVSSSAFKVSSQNSSPDETISSSESRVSSQTGSPDPSRSQPETPNSKPEARNPKLETDLWAPLFTAAGFDISKFQPTDSLWTPPRAYDARLAWSGVYPNLPQVPIRVEAAAYQGRPVYFEIISPWRKPLSESREESAGEKAFAWILLGIFFGIMLLAALLALRNLRAGRGDRRGAFRVALSLFLIRMVFWLFDTHHLADVDELMLLVTGLQSALFWSCFVGLIYLALEPYLRRRWPQRIISWNRLLAGDFRDPLVGRDLLIGAVIGSFAVMMMYLRAALPLWFGAYPGMPDIMGGFQFGLTGMKGFVMPFTNQISASIVQAFMIVFLLLFLSLLLRKDWLGITAGLLVLLILQMSWRVEHEHPVGLIAIAIANAAFVFSAVRFGPLALMSTLAFFHLWVFYPITTELTAWYASTFVLDVLVLLGLTIYAYYISLGGQSPLNVKLLAED